MEEDIELLRLQALAKQKRDAELAAQQAPQEKSFLQSAKDVALEGLDYAGRGLDYAGGMVRGGIAGGLEAATGKELVRAEDVMAGRAPSSAEILQKLEIPEGYSLSEIVPGMYSETGDELLKFQKGGMLDPTVRGAAGLALDVATDPLTYPTMGLSALGKVGRAIKAGLTPVGTLAGKRSQQLYKKAFETVDTNLKPLGKPYKIADILSREKFTGNMMEAADRVKQINDASGQNIGAILKEAASKGASVDLMKEFDPALKYAQELRGMATPEAAKLAQEIDERIMYAWEKTGGKIPVDEANNLKSFINDRIKESGFAAGDEAALSTQARKAIAGDLSGGIKRAVNKADPKLSKSLSEEFKVYSSTSDKVQDEIFKQAKTVKERREGFLGTGLTAVDLMLAGMGAQTGQWAPLAVKKAGEAAMSTKGRTTRAALGKTVEENKRIIDPVLRQGLWIDMMKKNEETEK